MTNEKRRFTRIPFKMHSELMVGEEKFIAEEISNLSVGGCMLPIAAALKPKTPCSLRISLSGSTDDICVMVEGEVVRSIQDSLALKFTRIDPDSLFHLQNIIRYNSPDADTVDSEINEHPGIL